MFVPPIFGSGIKIQIQNFDKIVQSFESLPEHFATSVTIVSHIFMLYFDMGS